jgi:hypothetical protein
MYVAIAIPAVLAALAIATVLLKRRKKLTKILPHSRVSATQFAQT